ncbi:uncharacterized protein LOC106168597 [Lingula anatina]|uniref:Uncharacterized protein LOC106168597 n=1 Tax=Lingula anatina TaxID=7574 RepID=A0A1S3IYX0_LINAN|nr:uncharacterized protein LOC106168597 [Lingula anatina]|eukprot:XP_013403181.1 uncharacterized protein LOC106168597 [Lingula anatina]
MAGQPQGGEGQDTSVAASELQDQLDQQNGLISQLKEMIRERDASLKTREKELEETNAKLSKLKLQTKAKAKAAQKDAEAKKGSEKADEESSGGDQAARAKVLVLKKKLDAKDKTITEKEALLEEKLREVANMEKMIAQRDEVVQTLSSQLERLHGLGADGQEQDSEVKIVFFLEDFLHLSLGF